MTKEMEHKIQEAMELPGRMGRQEPGPYFYTRLKARMESRQALQGRSEWKLNMAAILAIILLLANGLVIWNHTSRPYMETASQFGSEYGLVNDPRADLKIY